jgi:hypothetical protein
MNGWMIEQINKWTYDWTGRKMNKSMNERN